VKSPVSRALYKEAGFSLIELLVTLLLSSLLLLGVLQMFSNTSQADRSSSAVANLQDSARIAMELIKQDIRRAGYLGCADPQTGASGLGLNFPDDGIGTAASNSITLNYANPTSVQVTTNSTQATTTTTAYLLTDCQDVALFNGVLNGAIISSTTPGSISGFAANSNLHELNTVTYSRNGSDLTRSGSAVISEVSALNFSYGITDPAGNTAWANSVAGVTRADINQIKISITLTSATDAAVSKTFSSIVQLRNRL
jgi:type IV pilus assembly protein PilW